MSTTEQTTEQAETVKAPDPAAVKAATMREGVLRALYEEVKAAYNGAREETQQLLDQQQRATGGSKFDALLPDGTKFGSVSITSPEPVAQVVDDDALVEWCRKHFPAEIQTRIVFNVRPAFLTRILGEMTAAGAPRIVDEHGEIHDVPGVAVKPNRKRGHSFTYARKSKQLPNGGRALVADAWRRGELAPLVLPALAPAEADQ